MNDQRRLSAAVLTGGASRRMGTDKASISLGGMTLLERALAIVREVADEVFIVGDRPSYHRYGVRVESDAFPGAGTLGGIATALRVASNPRVLVVACDMPLLSPELLKAMVELPVKDDVVVPWLPVEHERQGGKGTYETLHAIYRRDCLPHIERRIADGELRVVGFFDDVRVRMLDEDWLRQYDPDLRSFRNANTPEELEIVRQLLVEEHVS
ncbi:MAG: molybdenum cofactor guanylyltransferase [Chloroflexota bacterium]|nr:molybdenum cofactor guanylyltransferase [Chloroflexota bacterium]